MRGKNSEEKVPLEKQEYEGKNKQKSYPHNNGAYIDQAC